MPLHSANDLDNDLLESVFLGFSSTDLSQCRFVSHKWNTAVNNYVEHHGITTQDQLMEKVKSFIYRKVMGPGSPTGRQWHCEFLFNSEYRISIFMGSWKECLPSKEDLEYIMEVKRGAKLPDPDKNNKSDTLYEKETCIFSKKLPERTLPNCPSYIKRTPYAQTFSVFPRQDLLPECVTAAITFPSSMEEFTLKDTGQDLRTDFILSVCHIIEEYKAVE